MHLDSTLENSTNSTDIEQIPGGRPKYEVVSKVDSFGIQGMGCGGRGGDMTLSCLKNGHACIFSAGL